MPLYYTREVATAIATLEDFSSRTSEIMEAGPPAGLFRDDELSEVKNFGSEILSAIRLSVEALKKESMPVAVRDIRFVIEWPGDDEDGSLRATKTVPMLVHQQLPTRLDFVSFSEYLDLGYFADPVAVAEVLTWIITTTKHVMALSGNQDPDPLFVFEAVSE